MDQYIAYVENLRGGQFCSLDVNRPLDPIKFKFLKEPEK